jgi:hypothetical protein
MLEKKEEKVFSTKASRRNILANTIVLNFWLSES